MNSCPWCPLPAGIDIKKRAQTGWQMLQWPFAVVLTNVFLFVYTGTWLQYTNSEILLDFLWFGTGNYSCADIQNKSMIFLNCDMIWCFYYRIQFLNILILSNLFYKHNLASYVIMWIFAPSTGIIPKQQREPFSLRNTQQWCFVPELITFCHWTNRLTHLFHTWMSQCD